MMRQDHTQFNEEIQEKSRFIKDLLDQTQTVIVGQTGLIKKIIIAMLADGHILLEGLPGLAKTLTIKTIADAIHSQFSRVQFTPDLLPADLIGTMIYQPQQGTFTPKKGPIFTNLVLADEINRAPAKVQSALLEAMAEHQVTLGDTTYPLPELFMVLATQNPIEQEGTYSLPEAQLDRFLFKVKVGYPSETEEKLILERMTDTKLPSARKICTQEDILMARTLCAKIHIDEQLKNYIIAIVFATRFAQDVKLKELAPWIQVGASPRATLGIAKAAKALAFLQGRSYITPEDIKMVAFDILRHRVILTFEAIAQNISSDQIIGKILDTVKIP